MADNSTRMLSPSYQIKAFHCLYSWVKVFYPKPMIIGKGRNIDGLCSFFMIGRDNSNVTGDSVSISHSILPPVVKDIEIPLAEDGSVHPPREGKPPFTVENQGLGLGQ